MDMSKICEDIAKRNMQKVSDILQMEITSDTWHKLNKANPDVCYLIAVAGWIPNSEELPEIQNYIKDVIR